LGGMAKAVEQGMPKRRIEESAAKRQANIDSGEEVIVGVNKYKPPTSDPMEVRTIDNTAVRTAQVARIQRVKAVRNSEETKKTLAALTEAAKTKTGNLLELAIVAARARATVGEISDALEEVYGRYAPTHSLARGAYGSTFKDAKEITQVQSAIKEFVAREGRPPRILVAKMGQDGHDRGAKVIATGFADMGYDVDVGPLFSTAGEVVRQAIDADVHVIGVSSLAAGHRTLIPELIKELENQKAGHIIVVCGGVIPSQDYDGLLQAGVKVVFGPGTKVTDAALTVVRKIEESLKAHK